MSGLDNPKSRDTLLSALHKEIESDKVLEATVMRWIGSTKIHQFLYDLLRQPPKVVIIIDELGEKVEEEFKHFGIQPQFIEFKTFVRIDVPDVRANLFEPISEVKEKSITEPKEYDLEYHFQRKNVTAKAQELYLQLDREIRNIDESVQIKYARTAITYYSPEKMFVFLRLGKDSLALHIFTDQEKIDGVKNIKEHENWGSLHVEDKSELPEAISAIKRSFELMKEAIKNNKNTGWYALTPRTNIIKE